MYLTNETALIALALVGAILGVSAIASLVSAWWNRPATPRPRVWMPLHLRGPKRPTPSSVR